MTWSHSHAFLPDSKQWPLITERTANVGLVSIPVQNYTNLEDTP